ncbi:SPFH domain-containing protein [Streptomyces sp. PR69]|uniref:SPFH domain-containing protein n=1 Tax=Streptomyces sp. PR69 TaxID=2984950 RepID=UPI0022649F93|nr:SPFH domain-containing protein [Streptomyces sp. PR69]
MNTTPPAEPHGEPQPPPEHPDGAYGGAPGEQPDPPVHVRPLTGGAGTAYAHAARGGRTGGAPARPPTGPAGSAADGPRARDPWGRASAGAAGSGFGGKRADAGEPVAAKPWYADVVVVPPDGTPDGRASGLRAGTGPDSAGAHRTPAAGTPGGAEPGGGWGGALPDGVAADERTGRAYTPSGGGRSRPTARYAAGASPAPDGPAGGWASPDPAAAGPEPVASAAGHEPVPGGSQPGTGSTAGRPGADADSVPDGDRGPSAPGLSAAGVDEASSAGQGGGATAVPSYEPGPAEDGGGQAGHVPADSAGGRPASHGGPGPGLPDEASADGGEPSAAQSRHTAGNGSSAGAAACGPDHADGVAAARAGSGAGPASYGGRGAGQPEGPGREAGAAAPGDAGSSPRAVFMAAVGPSAADLLNDAAGQGHAGSIPGGQDSPPHAPAVSDASRLAGAPPDSAPGEQTGGSSRRNPLIASETTTEIPVHLLFRDDDTGSIPLPPAVVNRKPLTGEFPKVQLPKARPIAPEPLTPRAAPLLDPKLAERPGPALPGWIGVVAGSAAAAGIGAVLWGAGVLPGWLTRLLGLPSYTYTGIGFGVWCLLALGVLLTLFGFGGLGRGRVGYAMVLTLFGEYRGSVRRTGLLWVSPLLLRRRVDVRLRHWRSEPMPVVDADGTALRAVVLVVWRVKDTVRAALGVEDHERFLREHVESAMARVLSQLPADVFHQLHQDAPTLRNAEAVGDSLTRLLQAECRPIGIEVFSAQPTRIDYAPEVAAAMQRRRIAAIDAKHRDSVLTSVVDAVDDTVSRLTSRGLVELDDYERKALVKDLTVAFYTGRSQRPEG